MRNTLLTLTALAGFVGAGFLTAAQAEPSRIKGASVQTVQYYGGVPVQYWGGERNEWREREWRRHENWERWRRWQAERRFEHRGW